jgi:hypothetical protein
MITPRIVFDEDHETRGVAGRVLEPSNAERPGALNSFKATIISC